MKIKYVVFGFLLATTFSHASTLDEERKQVIHQYVHDLEKADYKDISSLFDKNGTVISTSRGKINAKDFFYAFLPNIQSASTDLQQVFINEKNNDTYAARFHFIFKEKNGETDDGEYMDEFTFTENSNKLTNVAMFENMNFEKVN